MSCPHRRVEVQDWVLFSRSLCLDCGKSMLEPVPNVLHPDKREDPP